jgi:hypothetical protein
MIPGPVFDESSTTQYASQSRSTRARVGSRTDAGAPQATPKTRNCRLIESPSRRSSVHDASAGRPIKAPYQECDRPNEAFAHSTRSRPNTARTNADANDP